MPFEGYGGFSYSPVSVFRNAPPSPGIYGLSNAREWVFVGVTNDIRSALMAHLQDGDTEIKSRMPTGFTFELCHASQWDTRLSRLVTEYAPVCNKRTKAAP